jgi:hypothetical protein
VRFGVHPALSDLVCLLLIAAGTAALLLDVPVVAYVCFAGCLLLVALSVRGALNKLRARGRSSEPSQPVSSDRDAFARLTGGDDS